MSKRRKLAIWSLSLVLATVMWFATGCSAPQQPAPARQPAWSPPSAALLFSPPVVASAGEAEPRPLPPIELFNGRPTWPAANGVNMGELTFYRERYCDWQNSTTSGCGRVNDYVVRSFEIYRTGLIVK